MLIEKRKAPGLLLLTLASLLFLPWCKGSGDAPKPKANIERKPPATNLVTEREKEIRQLIEELRRVEIRKLIQDGKEYEVYPPVVDKIEKMGRDMIPYLITELRSPKAEVRYYASELLGSIGDSSVVPELVGLLGDSDERVISSASQALSRIRDEVTIPFIFQAIEEGKVSQVRWQSVLGSVKDNDMKLVPFLIGKLNSDKEFTRISAEILLNLITGKSFGFNPQGTEEERNVAIVSWEKWWIVESGRYDFSKND